MKNAGRWMGALGALLLCGSAQARQTPPTESKTAANAVFADDPRLLRNVKVQCEGIPVGDLLARLSQQTGVELSADKTSSEDKVIVFSPARPLRDILTDLAALYDDVWRQEKSPAGKTRYLLSPSLHARAREEALRGAANARLISQLDEQVKALAETPEQLAKRPDDDPIRKNLTDGEGPFDRMKRAATQVYGALTPAQREDLFARRWVNFPVSALNPQLTAAVRKLYQDSIRRQGLFRQPEDKQPEATIEEYAQRGVQFALHSAGGTVIPAVQVYGNNSMSATLFANVDARKHWPLPPHGNPYTQSPLPRAPRLPDALAIQEAEREKNWIDALHKLSETAAVPILADFYRSNPINPAQDQVDGLPPDKLSSDKSSQDKISAAKTLNSRANAATPAANIAALDAFCRPAGYLWWTRGSRTLLVRKRDWYEQSQYEVPDSWLRTAVARLNAQQNVPTIADVLRARDLTARQILGLNSFYTSNNYSYSEVETAGTSELLTFVEHELHGQPRVNKILQRGRVEAEVIKVEEASLVPMQDALQPFISAQSHPLALANAKFFRVDIYNADRSPAPDSSFKNLEVTLMWNLGNGVSGQQTVRLPFLLPDDRRDNTRIEAE